MSFFGAARLITFEEEIAVAGRLYDFTFCTIGGSLPTTCNYSGGIMYSIGVRFEPNEVCEDYFIIWP